ncbi:fungal-specific transcription factor domain-containing protein [Macrophomina phaseolina]|uniref:Fungal-specific transcription factor domain-containing protein n=1 Tax=Macrophomina phaseolina TaxID=35725 RepID=A0ABQ8FSZ8_9PEZI|nr:fungal-specific transcription factor domain-containing protein [Macrophomina phaseolina]
MNKSVFTSQPAYGGSQQPFYLPPHDTPPSPPPPSKPTYVKRGRITKVACLPCRRRKAKCDGMRPACLQCLRRDSRCQYNMTDEQRRLTFLRENVEHLEREKSELKSLLLALQRASEEDVADIMHIIRAGNDLQDIARQTHVGQLFWRSSGEPLLHESRRSGYTNSPQTLRSPPHFEEHQSLIRTIASSQPLELDEIVHRLRAGEEPASILASASAGTLLQTLSRDHDSTPGIEVEFSGREKFSLIEGVHPSGSHDLQQPPNPLGQPVRHWTRITDDQDWIEHLLSLYFSWQHPFFQSFPEQLFRADMASGRTDYCSPLLVNTLCAAGCRFSNNRRAHRDQDDTGAAGLDFFEMAVKLLNEEQGPTLMTIAALSILCHIESSFYHVSSQWQYSGRSSLMALDLHLHLHSNEVPKDHQSAEAILNVKACAHVFWGSFITDQITSFTLGRLPLIPVNAITMFFAPSRTITGSLLLEEYNKYTQWSAKLPAAVTSVEKAPPHVISLHMYYHAAVLLLFRPFLNARFAESNLSPREVCRQAANTVSTLFAHHLQLYGLNGILTFQIHCLLSACTIHMIKLPSISAADHLAAACNSFQDLVRMNDWATGSLNIIRSLVQKWKIILPLEVEVALYRDQGATTATPGESIATTIANTAISLDLDPIRNPDNSYSTALSDSEPTPDSMLSSSCPEKGEAHFAGLTTGSNIPQECQRPAVSYPNDTTAISPAKNSGYINTTLPTQYQQQVIKHPFIPFPNEPAPLLHPIHTSTSHNDDDCKDAGSDACNEESQKVNRGMHGLIFDGNDGLDLFMG